jgi:hypothetical protein
MITLTSTHEFSHGESLSSAVIKAETLAIRRGSPLQLRVSFYRNLDAANNNKSVIIPEATDPLNGLNFVNIPFETLGTYDTPAAPKIGAALEAYLEDQIKARIAEINAAIGTTAITYA